MYRTTGGHYIFLHFIRNEFSLISDWFKIGNRKEKTFLHFLNKYFEINSRSWANHVTIRAGCCCLRCGRLQNNLIDRGNWLRRFHFVCILGAFTTNLRNKSKNSCLLRQSGAARVALSIHLKMLYFAWFNCIYSLSVRVLHTTFILLWHTHTNNQFFFGYHRAQRSHAFLSCLQCSYIFPTWILMARKMSLLCSRSSVDFCVKK